MTQHSGLKGGYFLLLIQNRRKCVLQLEKRKKIERNNFQWSITFDRFQNIQSAINKLNIMNV